jgi:cytoskeletal protein CcmA (bactofilin family)
MSQERQSASVSGSGTLSGGVYSRISISGSGKVNGDIVVEELKVSGSGKVNGKTEAGQITISGSGTFADSVLAEEMRVSGSGKVEGEVHAKELKCSGSFRAKGGITSDYIKISGSLHSGGDVEADIFRATGGFDIEGLLSADKIEIHLGGRCRAREIGGEQIEVTRAGSSILAGLVRILGVSSGISGLETSVIEADEIHLEDTRADVVRGKNVVIGSGCRIGLVEYENELRVESDAEVKERKKT